MNRVSSKEHFEALKSSLTDPDKIRQLHAEMEVTPLRYAASEQAGTDDYEKTVTEWLGHLKLLHGVPFHYLVSDPRMLPQESIRFFSVDANWIEYLVDGACSIARHGKVEKAHDMAYRDLTIAASSLAANRIRHRKLGMDEDARGNQSSGQITGFMLRSSVLANWPGMEVTAYNNKTPLKTLRMEHLSESVLVAFFDGKFTSVEFRKAAEILHFGFDADDFSKKLRDEKRKPLLNKDNNPISVTAKFRDPERRVVNVRDLAKSMETETQTKPFTSAEFAMQMVARLERVSFSRLKL